MAEQQRALSRADFFDHLDNSSTSSYHDTVRTGGRDVAYDLYLKRAKVPEIADEQVLVEPERTK